MVGKKRNCEVCGAKESLRGGFFANFPIEEHRCKIWVKLVGKADLVKVPIETLHALRHVCGDHFEQKDFGKTGKRLKKTAFPKLHLSAPPLSDFEMKTFPQHVTSKQVLAAESLPAELAPMPSLPSTSGGLVSNSQNINANIEKETMATPIAIPEALKPISWLAGRWKTENGTGKYPNIPKFHYHEVLEFECIGQNMFNFSSISRQPEIQTPMHLERGFLRINPNTDELAFLVSHNFGRTSLEEGTVDPKLKQVVLTSSKITSIFFTQHPDVKSSLRVWKLIDQNTLEATVYMETDNTPLAEHLKAVYTKEL